MFEILVGDCIEQIRSLPDKSIHCCITSPPYFGLRDYQMDRQIGLEDTPEAFVARLVDVFREVRRVLRDDGTLWLNLGDSYAANRAYQVPSTKGGLKHGTGQSVGGKGASVPNGLKPKDLIGIPWRVAFALQADGRYLRQDIIWHKPNPMPESVNDRCTKSHEYIFMLSKSSRYFFDADAIKEHGVIPAGTKGAKGSAERANTPGVNSRPPEYKVYDGFRNRRSVWTVTTKPFKGAHFATFPPDLIEPCILAGAPERCCSACGMPYEREKIDTGEPDPSYKGSSFSEGKTVARDGGDRTQKGVRTIKVAGELRPKCKCDSPSGLSTVLDPFGGSGTTAGVALKYGRRAILCELNPDYVELMDERVRHIAGRPTSISAALVWAAVG
jgi:DNA modification methylase